MAKISLIIATLLCTLAVNAREFPPDFTAEYTVEKFSAEIGRAKYTLTKKNDTIYWTSRIYLTGLASLFLNDTVEETSELVSIEPGVDPLLISYSYVHKGSSKNRDVKADVEWDCYFDKEKVTGTIKGHSRGTAFSIPLTQTIWDQNSVILALISEIGNGLKQGSKKFIYNVFRRGNLKTQTWVVEGHEQLELGDDKIKSIKVHRKSGDRDTWLWLGTEFNYAPVKILQYKNGKSDMTMLLDTIRFHDTNEVRRINRNTSRDDEDF